MPVLAVAIRHAHRNLRGPTAGRRVGMGRERCPPSRLLLGPQSGYQAHREDHSTLMPANLITLAHFSVSSAISFPKSAGESASTSPPMSASRAFSLGSASAALTSLLSVLTISGGVFLGAPRPN